MPHIVSRILRVGLLLLPVIIVTALVTAVDGLAQILIIAALLAYVLDPLATFFEARGLTRLWATAVVFLMLAVLCAGILALLVPRVVTEIQHLQSGDYAAQTGAVVARLETLIQTRLGFLGLEHFTLADKIQTLRTTVADRLLDFFVNHGVTLIAHVVAVPFIIFFLLKDTREMKKRLISFVPNRYFEFALNLLYKMDLQLGNYLRGQFLDAAIFGSLSTIALWILNVPYFYALGAFAGLANLIPYAGPIVGGLAAVLVTVLTSPDLGGVASVVVAFIIAKLIDDALIQPIVVAKSVDIHPLIVLLVIIIGGHFFGILGMLLAVPATGFLKVAIEETVATVRKYRFAEDAGREQG
jgi:putative permease